VVEDHAGMQAGGFVLGFPGDEIKEFAATPLQVVRRLLQVGVQSLHGSESANRDDGEDEAGGDALDGDIIGDFVDFEASDAGDIFARVAGAEFRIALTHFAKRQTIFVREIDGNLANIQIKFDNAGTGLVVENSCAAERGMAGERELLLDGEDADANSAFALGRRVSRKNKSSLAEIGFTRQPLHFSVVETPRI